VPSLSPFSTYIPVAIMKSLGKLMRRCAIKIKLHPPEEIQRRGRKKMYSISHQQTYKRKIKKKRSHKKGNSARASVHDSSFFVWCQVHFFFFFPSCQCIEREEQKEKEHSSVSFLFVRPINIWAMIWSTQMAATITCTFTYRCSRAWVRVATD